MIIDIANFEVIRFWELNKVFSQNQEVIMSQFTIIGICGVHLRLHKFFTGDENNFHTHPRAFISLCISGEYQEEIFHKGNTRIVSPRTITVRFPKTAHKVTPTKLPCVTIALTSPVINQWEKF